MKNALILAGQSNMLGQGLAAELDSADLPARVQLCDRNPRAGCFGPELGFARRLEELGALEELWLIKYAVGGSSLLAWAPDWSAEAAAMADDAAKGPLYSRLLAHVDRVRGDQEMRIRACLWMQGESDSRYATCAAAYRSNLRRLIERMRQDVNEPQMAFLVGLANPPEAGFPYRAQVRDAQMRLAAEMPGAHLVDTAGLSKWEDELHYDTGGLLELGARYADMFARAVAWLA